jgi:DNA-binding NarL/FixJ family response regulator
MSLERRKYITLLLADDHPLARAGVRTLLSNAPDIQIIGEANDGNEAQILVAEFRPNVLLLDIQMPGPSAAEIEKWVRLQFPATATLILTAHCRDAYLAETMDAGVSGFLSKSESGQTLARAIRRAANGEILFDTEQLTRIYQWRRTAGKKWNSLTKRERQILRFMSAGCKNTLIAENAGITTKTVESHIYKILEKLDMNSRQEAVAWLNKYIPEDM